MDADTSHAEQLGVPTGAVTLLRRAARPNNLPVPLTSFVGRERELVEVADALAATRLLSLTGAGGCGKTRLAVRVAFELLDRFPGGAWWIELAPLGDEELVGATIAEALGVRPLPGVTPLHAAGAYLASRRALLVLDNCEHLLGACAEAAESLLQAGPDLVVLATGRAPLGVAGETDWRVPPLSLPEFRASEPGGSVAGSDAVRLFVERARKVRPSFALTDENAEFVVRICSELDGLPLAIELAAARVRMLSVEQIATGLSDRFRLLTGGPRTATPRQKTLRASVDWSHELLSEDERVLLRRAAVFAGGFTLEFAEQVCGGYGIERDGVLDLLASLVDQSLVIAEPRGRGVRYRLLETVRRYGLQKLAEAGERDAVRGRHRDAFLALAERAGPQLETARQREGLETLDPEALNFMAAIEHALSSAPELALRFCTALYRWWYARGRVAEAQRSHSRSIDACADREPALRSLAMRSRAYIAIGAGELEAAEVYATEALALAEELGDQSAVARARSTVGSARQVVDPRAGRAEFARAAELARIAGDDWALVEANQLLALGYMLQNDHAQAARANDEVAALAERLGDPLLVSRRWVYAGWMAVVDGRFAEARDSLERARSVLDGVGEPLLEGVADCQQANLDAYEGKPERALERLQSRLELALKLGTGLVMPIVLPAIAFVELITGAPDRARRRLEGLLPIGRRSSFTRLWVLCLLAEAHRLLDDAPAAKAAALQAQAVGERIGNRLLATRARLTLARLAAQEGAWTIAHQHAVAHLDACVQGGHRAYVPQCLDALGEIAAGLGNHRDAVRVFAAAERARAEIGVVRLPSEEQHWTAIESRLRDTLGGHTYETARREAAALGTDELLGWIRRARGPRRRPPGGWESLTPTEAKVAELVAQGLTNPQIADRLFVSRATVKTHLAHIFNKLAVHTRAELSAHAARRTTS